jgi:hypothetical protein
MNGPYEIRTSHAIDRWAVWQHQLILNWERLPDRTFPAVTIAGVPFTHIPRHCRFVRRVAFADGSVQITMFVYLRETVTQYDFTMVVV